MMQNKSKIFLLGLAVTLFMGCDNPAQAQQITWHSFEEALAIADSTGRPILVDVWAPWCGWCHKMQQNTYPALEKEIADNFVFTRLNRDDNETVHRYNGQNLTPLRLAQQLDSQSVPAVVLLSRDGTYLIHISGFVDAASLESVLEYIRSTAYRQLPFSALKK